MSEDRSCFFVDEWHQEVFWLFRSQAPVSFQPIAYYVGLYPPMWHNNKKSDLIDTASYVVLSLYASLWLNEDQHPKINLRCPRSETPTLYPLCRAGPSSSVPHRIRDDVLCLNYKRIYQERKYQAQIVQMIPVVRRSLAWEPYWSLA